MARVQAPRGHQRPRHRLHRAHHHRPRHGRAEAALSQEDADGGGDLVPALLRAQRRLGPGRVSRRARRTRAITSSSTVRRSGPRAGAIADWGILLARTDSKVAKHKGISCVLLNMRQPGVEVRPLKQITGHSLFSRSLHDQRARRQDRPDRQPQRGLGHRADDARLRARRQRAGARHPLRHRSSTSSSRATKQLKRNGRPLIEDPAVRGKLGASAAELEVQRYAGLRVLSVLNKGDAPGAAVVDHQALVHRVREALLGARAGDPRARTARS